MEELQRAALWILILVNLVGIFGGQMMLGIAATPEWKKRALLMMYVPPIFTTFVLSIQLTLRWAAV